MLFDREDTFLKEHAGVVAVAAGQAVQVELDRFSLATSLLAVAAKSHWGLPCVLAAPSLPDVMGPTPPDSVKSKFEKQVDYMHCPVHSISPVSDLDLSQCLHSAHVCSLTASSCLRALNG